MTLKTFVEEFVPKHDTILVVNDAPFQDNRDIDEYANDVGLYYGDADALKSNEYFNLMSFQPVVSVSPCTASNGSPVLCILIPF